MLLEEKRPIPLENCQEQRSEEIQVLSEEQIDITSTNSADKRKLEEKQNTSYQTCFMTLDDLVEEKDILSKQKEDEKIRAQLTAATRSMKTNLTLGVIFIVVLIIFLLVPDVWRPYFIAIVFTVMRGSMPILTAIANFGTVKFVALQYLAYIQDKFKLSLE